MSHEAVEPVIAAYRDLRDGLAGERDVFFLYDETAVPRAETTLPDGPEVHAVHYDRLDLDTYPNWQVRFRDWAKKSYKKEGIYGGKLEFIPEPEEMIRATLAHIDAKRAALGLPEYDPQQFGRSGDARMLELEELPLAERQSALYGLSEN